MSRWGRHVAAWVRVTILAPHALTRNLDSFSVFGAWALLSEDPHSVTVARTSPRAWVDLNHDDRVGIGDAVQSFAVIVAGEMGAGRFVVFGDDAIFQNDFVKDGNSALAKNLVCWLMQTECAVPGV
jgi:hypothetical protein